MKKIIILTWALLVLGLGAGAGCSADNQAVPASTMLDGAASPAVVKAAPARLFGGGYPTGGVNATSIQGVPVGSIGGTGSVLTVGAGPSLEWDVPAAGVMLSSTTPAGVGTVSGAVGVGTTAARADHVHLLPVVPLTLGGFGQSLAGLLTTPTELGYLHGATGPLQAQIDSKQGALTLPLSEANGGFGASVAGVGTGILVRSATNTPVTRSIVAGTGTTVTNGTGAAGNMSVNVTYGNSSSTATQGNDARLSPTPTAANKLVYDTGAAYAETSACSSTSTVLVGGSPPACGAVPDAALSSNVVTLTGSQTLTNKTLTTPAISSPALSGTSTGAGLIAKANGGFGQSVATGLTFGQGVYVDSSGVLQIGNVPFEFNLAFYGGTTTNEYAIITGNAVAPQLSTIGVPMFQSVAAGTCFLLTAQSDTPSSGTVTYRIRKSTDKGGTWVSLSPAVTCNYTNGTTTCTDSTNLGVIAAGDWIQPTVQWSVSSGLGYYGGVRFKCRYN